MTEYSHAQAARANPRLTESVKAIASTDQRHILASMAYSNVVARIY